TGLVGTRLVNALVARGDAPVVLTRNADAARKKFGDKVEVVAGDPMTASSPSGSGTDALMASDSGLASRLPSAPAATQNRPARHAGSWADALAGCDGVINLVGQGIFDRRWSPEFKKILVESRTVTTRNVANALISSPNRPDGRPKVLVSASAIGYYGPHGDEELDEDSPPTRDFLGQLCIDWEKEAEAAASAGVRVAVVRVGVVLDKGGGALAKLLFPFYMGGGGPVGSGRQYMAWIHLDDLVKMFLWALDTPGVTGPLNGTAPEPVTNKAFGHALGKAMFRPSFLWTPGFALSLLLGEAAGIVLNGQRVLPRRAQRLGFTFDHPTLDGALAQIFAKK
ncbi:MAG: TIGR01777 family oxidoreductase, partial [Gemmataceae bacterium]